MALRFTTAGESHGPGLTAIVEGPTSAPNGRGASLWAYLSTDGRRWTYKYSLNALS